LDLGVVGGNHSSIRPELGADAEVIMVDLACPTISCLIFN
jgi:hypothetical protein